MRSDRHYVLVPGAWLGGDVFAEVARGLRDTGHQVTMVTLSGIGDRRVDGVVGLDDHVRDILDVLDRETDPGRVILVGHSYSGIPVGQAASLFGGSVGRVVYLDANVPHDGMSFADSWSEEGRAGLIAAIEAGGGFWPPISPEELEDQDLTSDQISSLMSSASPHPGKTLTDPARLERPLGEIETTYVKCLVDWPEPSSDVKQLLDSSHWELVEMNTGHWPMLGRPHELTELLSSLA